VIYGVFGRCEQLAGADLHTYDISASALQRLRILLQKLAQRGLKWEDDITQKVISRELSKLRNVPFHHQSNSPSLLDLYSNGKPKPDQTELNRNLHKYLTGLGFLLPLDHEIVQQEGSKVQLYKNKYNPNISMNLIFWFFFFVCLDHLVSNAVNQLGRHSFNMEDLIGKDLHRLAEVIAGALQEVDEERPEPGARPAPGASASRGEMEANHEPLMSKLLNQDQTLKSETGKDPNQKNTLGIKQGLVHKMAGQENVQSRTTQGQAPVPSRSEEKTLTVPAKEGSILRLMGGAELPDAQVDSEMERWMQADQAPVERKKPVDPQKADMKIKTQLVHVGVKEFSSRGKDRHFGYIITGSEGSLTQIPVVKETRVESGQFLLLSILCVFFILVAVAVSATFFCVRQRSHLHMKEKLASLGTDTSTDATATYQELCRQRMAIRTSERVERPETLRHSRLNSVSSQFSDGPAASPSTRSSTSSWCEEPVPSNMDISTGHMILSYMEDHLKNKNRLEREWEALCSYQAEPSACSVGQGEQNSKRNRSDGVVAYDHSRITLKAENNHGNSDYINASPIMDHDPRNPTYIAAQGPLASTVADFWQMVWESGCVVIVMLTPLSENGVKQCHHYWPDEGSDVYHIYEVNLVSEHIWCEDFLVRSFYLKNLQTNETRTVTQFHFLSWMDRGIPTSARTLLDFRRKVNKCYRGRSCPIIVHCSDGAGRSGTYILIDMVLNRMAKGAKEIDIAATLEHLRDQRAGMVQIKEQFEFALTAVAEEVNAILKALPQ
uniref:Protein tyrosine phosphatase receptor type N2 n=1 Tax=Oryzias sinensis TaxID=183150 RepID=A0A8C7XC05_9TELE